MHRTGKYRMLTLICGIFPFISAVMLSMMKEDSHPLLLWLGIVRPPHYCGISRFSRNVYSFRLGLGTQSYCKQCSVSLPNLSKSQETTYRSLVALLAHIPSMKVFQCFKQ